MTKKEKWKAELLKVEDKYAELIAKYILKLKNQEIDLQVFIDYISDLIYKDLEEIYVIAKESVEDRYGKVRTTKIDLKNLLYNKDGKTLNQRINEHYVDFLKNSNYNLLLSNIIRILHTENMNVYNQVVKSLVKQLDYVAGSYDGSDCDCHSEDMDCSEYTGLYLIDDLPDAPFHPNCNCEPEYYHLEDLSEAEREELGLTIPEEEDNGN